MSASTSLILRHNRMAGRVRNGRDDGRDRKQVRRGDAQHRIANRGNDARQYSRIRRVGDISRVAARYQYLQDCIGAAVKRCGADDENPQATAPLDQISGPGGYGLAHRQCDKAENEQVDRDD